MTIKVILADDHTIVRQGLRLLLDREEGITVIAEADNGRTALQLVKDLSPDLVVMDISMPEMNGIEATRRILSESPSTRVLALSMHSDRRFVDEVMKAGATGFILKDCAKDELVKAIRLIADSSSYIAPVVAANMIQNYIHSLSGDTGIANNSKISVLSSREREVLQLIAEGKNTKEIAFALNLSVKTIETHRLQIMKKLNKHNAVELARFAIREGVTTL